MFHYRTGARGLQTLQAASVKAVWLAYTRAKRTYRCAAGAWYGAVAAADVVAVQVATVRETGHRVA